MYEITEYFDYKKTIVNNKKMWYWERKGKDPPIILLHGLANNAKGMYPVASYLKVKNKIILLDLPGFGKSDELEENINFENISNSAVDFAKKMKFKKIVFGGASFGAVVSLDAAILYPEIIDKILLIAPPIINENSPRYIIAKKICKLFLRYTLLGKTYRIYNKSRLAAYVSAFYFMKHFPKDIIDKYGIEGRRMVRDKTFFTMVIESVKYKTLEQVQKIKNKCLIITASQDNTINYKEFKTIVKQNKNIILNELNIKGGHSIHLEHPEIVAECINEYLSNLSLG